MISHQQIDERSLILAQAIVRKIDADPDRKGLEKARAVCARWRLLTTSPAVVEWSVILQRPWEEIRSILLDESDEGRRRRQSDPFCGVLSPHERWEIYRS